MDQSTCKTACDKLNIPNGEILGNYGCYKDGGGYCHQNGKNGGGASMICMVNGKSNEKNIGKHRRNKMIHFHDSVCFSVFQNHI